MITIEGELYSSKNSKQIVYNPATKRPVVVKSKVAKADEKALCYKLMAVKRDFLRELEGKAKPYQIEFKIYRQTHRRFDYINIIQNLCDCMVMSGLIEDDNADILIPIFKPYEVDKSRPRVEITIREQANEEQ